MFAGVKFGRQDYTWNQWIRREKGWQPIPQTRTAYIRQYAEEVANFAMLGRRGAEEKADYGAWQQRRWFEEKIQSEFRREGKAGRQHLPKLQKILISFDLFISRNLNAIANFTIKAQYIIRRFYCLHQTVNLRQPVACTK